MVAFVMLATTEKAPRKPGLGARATTTLGAHVGARRCAAQSSPTAPSDAAHLGGPEGGPDVSRSGPVGGLLGIGGFGIGGGVSRALPPVSAWARAFRLSARDRPRRPARLLSRTMTFRDGRPRRAELDRSRRDPCSGLRPRTEKISQGESRRLGCCRELLHQAVPPGLSVRWAFSSVPDLRFWKVSQYLL